MIITLIDRLNEAVGRVVSIVAVIFAAIIIYDVFMRYAMNAPTRWAFDVTKQLYGFYFVMLGGYALRHQAHVRVDLVTERLRPVTRRWVEVVPLDGQVVVADLLWEVDRWIFVNLIAVDRARLEAFGERL